MAKGTSGRGNATGTPSSLTSLLALTKPAMPLALADPVIYNQLFHGNYDESSDRRRYNPTKRSAAPHAANRNATRLLIGAVGKVASGKLPHTVRFRLPNLVTLCIRRQLRREVLHALNRTRTGRGGRNRRNIWSDIKC